MASLSSPGSIFYVLLLILCSSAILFADETKEEVEDEHPFLYEEETGKGPKNWGSLKPEWKICGTGKLQSPIDLLDERVQLCPDLGKLKRDYKPAPATIKNRGHDIVVHWKGYAGQININGTYYKLVQCHWHTPSEHTVNEKRFNLELHAVHESDDGKSAVIGILYEYGRPDPLLSKLIPHIKSIGEEERDLGILNPGVIKFGSRKYYRYLGSLTVPPCTEGVVWTIVKKVRTVSREQVKALRDAVNDGFEENSRPTQELDGRPLWLYTKGP
ncbi:alpha carbonic anhydrase 4-like [Neltuma alba]|uniref:alpha carbonic anhydrase 4-like n=1 Tax=Neltuma alba TaxID=207710 RepID=UPI0010A41EC4|nr:alpha carbonic anhydrase 4-like [Prosopis alba]